MIRVGLVGLGGVAGIHICAYDRIKEAKIVAVADALGEAAKSYHLAKDRGAKLYTDFEKMIECEELDAIDICAPTHLHKEISIKALERGLHVICEKPMASSYSDACQIAEAAEKSGKLFMTAQVVRFMRPYKYLKSVIESGELGKLVNLKLKRLSAIPAWRRAKLTADAKANGGVMLDLSIHDIDFTYSVLGMPDAICGVYHPVNAEDMNDYFSANLTYGGATVNIDGGFYNADIPFCAAYHAIFENGYIECSADGAVTICGEETDIKDEIYPDECDKVNVSLSSAFVDELEYFVNCVLNGEQPEFAMPKSTATGILLTEKIIEKTEKI